MEDFLKKMGLLQHQAEHHPVRHGVTRKTRELNDKKDITKLFRKKPIGLKRFRSQVKESKHSAGKEFLSESRQAHSCATKETVGADSFITTSRSRNSDMKIMHPIRM